MPAAPLARARKLLRPRHRRASGLYLAEGPHVVGEALAAGARLVELFLTPSADPALRRAAEAAHVPVRDTDEHDLRSIADTDSPQGVVAVAELPAPREPFDAPGLWLLLCGVQDPGNVGTLLRAAEAFGARGVVAAAGTADLWSGKVVRAGQGAHFRLALVDAGPPEACAEALHARGGELWAATLDGEPGYDASPPPGLCAVALGNETRGLPGPVLEAADRRVRVPQAGRADSLNVAVAGAVLLSWLAERARRQGAGA
jgi:RNA methyltransferase, TrmH family